jgi:chromosome segregation ATPase
MLLPACRHCAAAEGRVLSGEQRIAELAGEVAALQEQLGGALAALQEARSEGAALRDELGALGEDMQALVRENQVGGRELMRQLHGAVSTVDVVLELV